MNRLINPRIFMLIILSAFIAGCGGGGSGSNNVTPSSGEWDSMTWDQDNWA